MGRGPITLLTMLTVLTVLTVAGTAHAGSTRCWIDEGAVVAAAAFGDIAGDFIIDVGAPTSELHVTAANLDGITEDSAVRSLVFAGHRLAKVRMKVVDLDAVPPTDTNIAGVIGADVLSRYSLAIEFSPCRVIWGSTRSVRGTLSLPIRMVGGAPTVEARASDGASVRDGPFIVSTGQTETMVPGATLSRAPKPGSFSPVRLRAITVGGRLLEQVPGAAADGAIGSIGTGVWRGWQTMRLDWKRRSLELTPLP